jgi:hypothetical protein
MHWRYRQINDFVSGVKGNSFEFSTGGVGASEAALDSGGLAVCCGEVEESLPASIKNSKTEFASVIAEARSLS